MALATPAPGFFSNLNSFSSKPLSFSDYCNYKQRLCNCGIRATATATATATSPGSLNGAVNSYCDASVGRKFFPLFSVKKKLQRRFSWASFSVSFNSTCRREGDNDFQRVELINRRQAFLSSVGSIAGYLNAASFLSAPPAVAASSGSGFADMPALRGKDYGKTKMRYPDYIETESGLQFKDLRKGTGPTPKNGETVVVDWDGYTIGYYGRIFEARNKTKGGSFEGDEKEFFKFKIGTQEVIPAFEEAVLSMSLGGIRRVIVPPELGYPDNDYNKQGPKPTTFSGQRALDFVLRNQGLIDKTLLFDIELLKIVPN